MKAEQHWSGDLVRLRPRPDTLIVSQGRTVMEMAPDGFITPDSQYGLFAYETRLLSRYSFLIDGKPPMDIALSNVQQHTWMGYYAALPPRWKQKAHRPGEVLDQISQHTIELRVSRSVGQGMHEDLDLTNFTQHPVRITLEIALDADFADLSELQRERRQKGILTRRWRKAAGRSRTLTFDYRVAHRYSHQGNAGTARIHRRLTVLVENSGSAAGYRGGKIRFQISLAPHATWHACLKFAAEIDGDLLEPPSRCHHFGISGALRKKKEDFLRCSTDLHTPGQTTLQRVIAQALERSKQDLLAMRLFDLEVSQDAWTVAAGIPSYMALFGRDTLTTSWQAALLGPELMQGTLPVLARLQGEEDNAWRDERPGKMLHEAHRGPLAALCFSPLGRYYGSVSTSAFYPRVVAELWRWTGDRQLVAPFLEPALRALRSLDSYGDVTGDGFYSYKTRSVQGLRNQGWKDSDDAIVHEDGSTANPPISMCEEQAFVFDAKMQLAQVLWWMGRKDEAHALSRQAHELQKRFQQRFWMEKKDFVAMGLDGQRRQIRSIASDPGQCMATGILDQEQAARVSDRLLSRELFSGWGVRTLSAKHPAFNPYSYHRGSVWPVEHGALAIGLMRHGFIEHLHTVCRALFEAAMLFEFYRLPEVFSGHARDAEHPFPALYAKSNWPQAWSASAVIALMRALLGVVPFAPLGLLFVDPHLPDWLPELTLRGLRVGKAQVDLRFYRTRSGNSNFDVLEQRGKLEIYRKPSAWSLSSEFSQRHMDSLLAIQ